MDMCELEGNKTAQDKFLCDAYDSFTELVSKLLPNERIDWRSETDCGIQIKTFVFFYFDLIRIKSDIFLIVCLI
jgi:hypothetical protein